MFTSAVAAVSEVADLDPRFLDRDEVLPAVQSALTMIAMLQGAVAGFTARLDADEIYADDQFATASLCIAAATNGALPAARRLVKQASALRELPAKLDGLRSGVITMDHAECLIHATNPRTREAMAIDEASFVLVAQSMKFRDFVRKVANWSLFKDADGAHDPVTAASTLDLRLGVFGRGELVGDFVPSDMRELRAMLDPEVDRLYRQEIAEREVTDAPAAPMRTGRERRAAAFMNLVLRAKNGDETTISNSASATIGIIVTPRELRAASGAHAVDDNTPIAQPEFERLACDSEIYRVVMKNGSEALDLGRGVRTASPAQKRMLAARDGGCVVPGCDATPRLCHAHHVSWWSHEGKTDINNFAMLCRTHHEQVHERRWIIRIAADQTITFEKPDGTELRRRERARPPRNGTCESHRGRAPNLDYLEFLRQTLAAECRMDHSETG
jgi:hypothetical protein